MRGWMLIPEFDSVRQSVTPGRCFMCKSPRAGRQVVCSGEFFGGDGVHPSRAGKVQFCSECIKAAAGLLGLVPSDVVERLDASIKEHNEAKKHLRMVLDKLNATLKTVEAM